MSRPTPEVSTGSWYVTNVAQPWNAPAVPSASAPNSAKTRNQGRFRCGAAIRQSEVAWIGTSPTLWPTNQTSSEPRVPDGELEGSCRLPSNSKNQPRVNRESRMGSSRGAAGSPRTRSQRLEIGRQIRDVLRRELAHVPVQ